MSSVIPSYLSPQPIRSVLFESPSDTVPPTDELEALHAELKVVKQKTLERARKAGEDLKTIEESMRRLKEKEKGKAKATEKVKRERGFTPSLNGDDTRHTAQPQPSPHRPHLPSVPATPVPPTPVPVIEIRKSITSDTKKKKKKRKREDVSDGEQEHPTKARKASPVFAHTHQQSLPLPSIPKAAKYPSASLVFTKAPGGQDFALPQQTTLLPSRPQVQPPPIPGPSKSTDVREDFSKSKAPAGQVQVTTFYTSIEPWLRPVKEEDVGFLEYTGDDVEPFVMPKLGRHYTELWEEEDTTLYGGPLPVTATMRAGARTHPPNPTGPLPRWEPSTLMETDLLTEERGHGPLTERLVTALIPMHNAEWRGVKAAEEAMEGRPGTNGAAAAAARDKLNVADLEERVRNVLRFHGLLDEIPDYSEAVDDPIATALRHAQRELRTVYAANKLRRTRLADIARDRLGYQEYVDCRESLDKNITSMYTKLQKKDGPKANKKKKKSTDFSGAPNGVPTGLSALPPCPSALGLSPDEENHLHVPEQLRQLVQTRRDWVDNIGAIFEEKQQENPGRIWGLPNTSVFDGIDDEVRQDLTHESTSSSKQHVNSISSDFPDARTSSSSNTSKGKQKATGDDLMEIG